MGHCWQEEGGANKVCYIAATEAEVAAVRIRAKEAHISTMQIGLKGAPENYAVMAVGPVPTAALAALVEGLTQA